MGKDGELMKQIGQEGYTYLGIIELGKIKETEMKEKKKAKINLKI